MAEDLQYQIRFGLTEAFAKVARLHPESEELQALTDIMKRHGAAFVSQYDAFSQMVLVWAAQAERSERDEVMLRWTAGVLLDPTKAEDHKTKFTAYVDGQETYDEAQADQLKADLDTLKGQGLVTWVTKHDTNPAHNPQPPR